MIQFIGNLSSAVASALTFMEISKIILNWKQPSHTAEETGTRLLLELGKERHSCIEPTTYSSTTVVPKFLPLGNPWAAHFPKLNCSPSY